MVPATSTLEQTRQRLIWTLFTGNAIGSTAYIGIATVAALIANDITGSTSLAGLPGATGTLGLAAGAAALSWMSYRTGRRPSFTIGYAIAVVGTLFVIAAIGSSNFLLLLLGMAGIGVGRSVGQLARYAAGDMRSDQRRGSAISLIVWASTIGAVLGPPLIGPTGLMASRAGLDELVGPVMVATIGFALVAILMFVGLRPDPLSVAVSDKADAGTTSTPLSALLSSRLVQLSIAAIVVSQVVMVLVMVMTPIHVRANDGGLSTIGWIMMAHTLGMFAIAPITGWLISRVGAKRMIAVAVGVFLVACGLAATATSASTLVLLPSLFLLGVAWNFGFVSGSTLLQTGLSVSNRIKLQGFADATAWLSSAAAAAASGFLLSATSYQTLALAGAAFALLPLLPLYRFRTAAAA
ncbi:MAG: MFS transporter [Actinomycetota bacterium]|nr:MFS transporter [Actinomycetota bacterium]